MSALVEAFCLMKITYCGVREFSWQKTAFLRKQESKIQCGALKLDAVSAGMPKKTPQPFDSKIAAPAEGWF